MWARLAYAVLFGAVPLQAASGITGTWQIASAQSPSGGTYHGTVNITGTGPVFNLAWATGGGAYGGVGMQLGNHLFAGWAPATVNVGIVVYRVQPNGTLVGQWTVRGASGVGEERATGGQPGVIEGSYVVTGSNPGGGSPYRGSLRITREGNRYHLYWSVGQTYEGSGLVDNNMLAVGWGGASVGLVEYAFSGNTAQGRWTTLGVPGVGFENLTR
jgi:hypothetical protein